MKKILFLFLCFIHLSSFAQDIQILSKQDSTEVPYVDVIYFANDSIVGGTYTDEDGKVTLKIPLQCNTIEFSTMGYNTVKISKKDLNSVIYLEELPMPLHEIVLTSSKIKKKKATKLGYPIKHKRYSFNVKDGLEVVTLFKPNTQNQRKLYAFLFYLTDKGFEFPDDYASVFRIVFYENNDNKPYKQIHIKDEKQQVFTINAKQYGKIKLNIDRLNITLPQEGLFVGIEYIGFMEGNGKDIQKNIESEEESFKQPSISFLKQKKAEKTYIRWKFKEKGKNWLDTHAYKNSLFSFLKENEHFTPAFAIEVY
ncbi:MAG: hypothetical protein EAZ95_08355 [Bacteroidetes bacterium]|nr:MAG: hypothetical protein EAZ95_08355 [Bacteroidota bacterium]